MLAAATEHHPGPAGHGGTRVRAEDITRQLELSGGPFAGFRALPGHRRRGRGLHPRRPPDRLKGDDHARKLGADKASQLAGYLLLDYLTEHGIREVGLYLSRHRAVVSWTMPDLGPIISSRSATSILRRSRSFASARGHSASHYPGTCGT